MEGGIQSLLLACGDNCCGIQSYIHRSLYAIDSNFELSGMKSSRVKRTPRKILAHEDDNEEDPTHAAASAAAEEAAG